MDPVGTTLSTLNGVWALYKFSDELLNSPKEVESFKEVVDSLTCQLMVLRDLRTQLRNLRDADHGQIRDTLFVEKQSWAMAIRIDDNISRKIKDFRKPGLVKGYTKVKAMGFWVMKGKQWIDHHKVRIESINQSLERRIQCVRGLLPREHNFEGNTQQTFLPRKAMHVADTLHELSV